MTEPALPEFELFALRYATRSAQRRNHFIGGDPHDAEMPMDYYVWLARSPERTVLIDTGFRREVAERKGRTFLIDPVDALAELGVAADEIRDIAITHLHYDHVGNLDQFSSATFHVQEREMAFATGPHMRHPFLSKAFEVDDVTGMVRLNYQGRVRFHDGASTLCPGITLHLVGGHSHGLQFVAVNTRRGTVVLASDAAHFYENVFDRRPFTISYQVGEMLDGFETMIETASSPAHVVPGHDPLVMTLYPQVTVAGRAEICRLDVPPTGKRPAKTGVPEAGYASE